MTVWLVAEDRVQIVRADHVATFAVAPVSPSPIGDPDPVRRIPNDRVRILAGTHAGRDPEQLGWTALLTFTSTGSGKAAVRVLQDLAITLTYAEERDRTGTDPALFVHGPLPRLNEHPERAHVWRISTELPTRSWPTSGTQFGDPLP